MIKLTYLLSIIFISIKATIALSQQNNIPENKMPYIFLENKQAKAKISLKGAELQSFYNKKDRIEHIWQADKNVWKKHAPILFPIVGKLKNNEYFVDGKTYKMKRHGFAQFEQFTVINSSKNEVTLMFESNNKTLQIYPYKFRLFVDYRLKGTKLTIKYTVKNIDNKTIYFSIGAHPGFRVPFFNNQKFEDYYIEFANKVHADRLLRDKKTSLLNGKVVKNYIADTNRLALSYDLFKEKVIILEGIQAPYLLIKSNKTDLALKIGIKNFPYLGLWTSSKNAPLLCIEPWHGVTGSLNFDGNLAHKKGINQLDANKSFSMSYYIQFLHVNK